MNNPIIDIVYSFPEDLGSLKKLVTYAICSDGIYLIRKAGQGHIVTKEDGVQGLSSGPGHDFNTILKRKIPFVVYWKIVEFFRAVLDDLKSSTSESHGGNLEAFILVIYNPKTDSFHLYVPPHRVSGGRVEYDIKGVKDEFPGCYIVLDVHSHHSMGAFFSGTDDKDDNRDRYSGVIGKIDGLIPDFKVRFNTLGKHVDFSLEDIFIDSDEKIDLDIKDGLKRVSLIKSSVSTGSVIVNRGVSATSSFFSIGRSAYQGLLNPYRSKLNSGYSGLDDMLASEEEY